VVHCGFALILYCQLKFTQNVGVFKISCQAFHDETVQRLEMYPYVRMWRRVFCLSLFVMSSGRVSDSLTIPWTRTWVTVWPYHGPGREWQFDHTMDQDSLRVYSLCLQICICTYRWLVRCQCFCFTLCCYVLMHFCCTKLYISVAYAVMWCLSFCLSHSCIMWKWVIIFSNFFHHSVFPYQML